VAAEAQVTQIRLSQIRVAQIEFMPYWLMYLGQSAERVQYVGRADRGDRSVPRVRSAPDLVRAVPDKPAEHQHELPTPEIVRLIQRQQLVNRFDGPH
jgi:hypothetical protein